MMEAQPHDTPRDLCTLKRTHPPVSPDSRCVWLYAQAASSGRVSGSSASRAPERVHEYGARLQVATAEHHTLVSRRHSAGAGNRGPLVYFFLAAGLLQEA